MKRRQMGVALALVACAAGTWTSGALSAGDGATAKTKVRMKMQCDDGICEKARALTAGSFKGRVRSSAAECVDGRTVKVIRKGVSPGPIDSVEAAANGKWTLESDDLLPGTYFAKTPKTTEGGTKCKPAKSKKWTLEFARSARADVTKVKTTVTIKDECPFACRNYDAHFFGKVKADESSCERQRKVILLRKGKPGEGFLKIDQTKSDGNGDWEIIRDDKPGFTDYMVKVKEVRKALLRCLGATSDKESHVAPGRAHNEEFESTITIKEGPPGNYKGKVISDSADCMKNRRVTLIAKEEGSDAEFVIGHDRTDDKGRWRYQIIGEGYYATVKKKVIERGDHKHTCLFDRSPTTPFRR